MRPERQVREEGYLTLDNVPDADARRAFLIPTDPKWFGTFMGAIAPLLSEEAWRQYGTLTPEECAAEWQKIFFSDPPCGCELPDGGKIIRINNATGHLEELSDDTGEWVEPSGDYAVPPIAPREDPPEDAKCLAAENAAHVLELLYENITDSIAADLEAAEAYTAMVAAFIALVGWEFAPIAFALATFFLGVFALVYETVKIIGADVWNGDFTDVLKCALLGCASDDGGGVITFDWTCTRNALAPAGSDVLSFDQWRLFYQLYFIITVIGGADGLNQAGATTAITEAMCDDCADGWIASVDLTDNDGGFEFAPGQGHWEAGVGLVSENIVLGSLRTIMQGQFDLGETLNITSIGIVYDWQRGAGSDDGAAGLAGSINDGAEIFFNVAMGDMVNGDDQTDLNTGTWSAYNMQYDLQCSNGVYGGYAHLKSVTLNGTGTVPTVILTEGWVLG